MIVNVLLFKNEKEARAKLVLSSAKDRITRVENKNKELENVKVDAELKIAELSASNKNLTEDLIRMEAAKVRNKLILLFIMLILNIDTFRTRVWVGLTSWRVRSPV